MKEITQLIRKAIPLILLLLAPLPSSYAQGQEFLYFYRVYFRDKNTTQMPPPEQLLSPRAVERRQKHGIPLTDLRDIPVSRQYLNQVAALGFTLHSSSKWMNTGLFKTTGPANMTQVLALPFVSRAILVKHPLARKSDHRNKLDFETGQDNPPFNQPIIMLNGSFLHESGNTGEGLLIAVLDGGFLNANTIESLQHVRQRGGILATYDFVEKNQNVYDAHTHGTAVLSILAGKLQGYIQGTAPGASYILIKTEDVTSEFPVEEDLWAAGAEYADSCGADIISASLGYSTFDDPSMDYTHGELDGNTAFVTRAADIAASKGILVVNSAGNERDNLWQKIIFPSDGDSVLAVGAVTAENVISGFSSSGYSADGRVKPDNVAMGVSVTIQTIPGYISRGNGTSFSCPVLSGMAACLMQAVPKATNKVVIDAFHASGDRSDNPDPLYGYGLPDVKEASGYLQNLYTIVPDEDVITFPNPTTGYFTIVFRQPQTSVGYELFSASGKLIFRQNPEGFHGRVLPVTALQSREQGVYFLRIIYDQGTTVLKIIKLRE